LKIKGLTTDEMRAMPFMLPGLLASIALIIYPLIYILHMSFMENAPGGTGGFAGLDNFTRLVRNPMFAQALSNTLQFTFTSVVFAFVIGFGLALIIQRKGVRFKGLWRSILFITWIIPGVVKATSWRWLFTTDGGMINHMLLTAGFIDQPVPWLTSPRFALTSIIIVQIWSTAPYVMLMMTAGLQQLPKELFESADIDGANWFQKVIKITLPLLKDVSFISVLLLLVWAINEFALIWIMTSGGQNTTTISILIFNQFRVLNLNAASASAVLQLVITMLFAGIYVAFVTRGSAKED
jgi:ABC-type sugar transport system permease subunit